MNKKIVITLTIIVWALYTIGNASIVLNFPNINIQSFGSKFSLVHFTAPGNDFVGSFFRLPSKSTTGTTITLSGDRKTCTKQVRGLYFNSQRGKRIRPLDEDTRQLLIQQNDTYKFLTITWWLYTSCEQTSPYSIFWSIKYTQWGKASYIVAGTKFNYQENKIVALFAKSFQYFDNKVPIGYIYDSNGGIWFVGGNLSGDEALINFLNSGWAINSWFMYSWSTIISNTGNRTITIESWSNAMETMRNLIIQWSVWLSKSINEAERLSLLGNFQNKTVIYNGSDINSSTLINFAKQKAQTLCQGKTLYTDHTLSSSSENTICIQNHDMNINLSDTSTYENKTIIVKSGNVILKNSMQENSPALDLFVDKWVVYLTESFSPQTFNDQWFPSNTNPINSWLYLKGNFIINGLMIGWTPGFETWFNHKVHIQWKITLLNTPLEPNTGRISQIENIFWWSTIYDNFINLQNVFVRTCNLNGTSSDWSLCSTGGIISTTPLVILNGNYLSNLLQ